MKAIFRLLGVLLLFAVPFAGCSKDEVVSETDGETEKKEEQDSNPEQKDYEPQYRTDISVIETMVKYAWTEPDGDEYYYPKVYYKGGEDDDYVYIDVALYNEDGWYWNLGEKWGGHKSEYVYDKKKGLFYPYIDKKDRRFYIVEYKDNSLVWSKFLKYGAAGDNAEGAASTKGADEFVRKLCSHTWEDEFFAFALKNEDSEYWYLRELNNYVERQGDDFRLAKGTKKLEWKNRKDEWEKVAIIDAVTDSYIVEKYIRRAETINKDYSPSKVLDEIVWSEEYW